MSTRWIFEEVENGHLSSRVGRDMSAIVAEWPGVGSYRSDRLPRFVADSRAAASQVRKLERGAVRALDRWVADELSLHGSAVELDGAGVAFVGESGAGKSTLAAALVLQHGASLIADDIVAVDDDGSELVLLATDAEHWLDSESRRALGLGMDNHAKEPVSPRAVGVRAPLRLLVELVARPVERASPCGLSGRAVLETLARAAVNIPGDPARDAAHFARLGRLAQTPLMRLERPAEWHDRAIDDLVRILRDTLRGKS